MHKRYSVMDYSPRSSVLVPQELPRRLQLLLLPGDETGAQKFILRLHRGGQ